MGIRDLIGGIGEVIQKPQSLMMGAFNELAGTADEDRRFIDAYEYGDVENSRENQKRYELAKMRVGDSSGQDASGLFSGGGLFQGLKEGLDQQLRPSDYIEGDSIGGRVAGTAADMFIDPTILAGGAVKGTTVADDLAKSAPNVAKFFEGAGQIGKVDDLGRVGKAGQMGRRWLQGTLATGDPLTGAAAGGMIGLGERGLSSAISRALAKGVGEKSDELIKGLDNVVEDATNTGEATQMSLFDIGAKRPEGQLFDPDTFDIPVGGIPTGNVVKPKPTPQELMAQLPNFQSQVPYAPTLQTPVSEINNIPMPGTGVQGLRKELPVGARPMPGPEGSVPLDEALQALLGRRQGEAFGGGQRADTVLRDMLANSRSGKNGRFLSPEQKQILQQWISNPDSLTAALRGFYG